MKTIIVLISANAEWRAVRRNFPGIEIQQSPLGEWFETGSGGGEASRTLLFFHGGWGKISAAASAQYVLDRWSPDMLINLGTCGGFESRVSPGVIILVERTVVYDILEQMGDPDEALAFYTSDIDLSWLDGEDPPGVVRSLLVSADRDLMLADLPRLVAQYGAVAGDWESGAIAWVAARNGVRTLILRGVSDLIGPGGNETYGDYARFESATQGIMDRLLDSLPDWIVRAGQGSTQSL